MMSALTRKATPGWKKIQFDPYNESSVFQKAVKAYSQRTGHYPARALVDQIYRTRKNRDYCKEHGIRMSGPKLGRPSRKASTKEEYQDNTDRIEVERFFSLDKRCSGAGLIMTRLSEYNAVIDCPVGACDESIPQSLPEIFFCLFCGKRKRIRFHPFHRIRSSVTSLRGVSKVVRDFGRGFVEQTLNMKLHELLDVFHMAKRATIATSRLC